MRTLATYTCEEHDITVDSSNADVTGDILFINGMLAHVLNSRIQAIKISPLSKARYYTHKVLCFAHITNKKGH